VCAYSSVQNYKNRVGKWFTALINAGSRINTGI